MRNFTIREITTALCDLVMPRECIVCGSQLVLHEKHLCLHCLSDLPRTHYSGMRNNPLADRFNSLIESRLCAEGERYAYATSLFFYRSGYRKITQRLKYHSDLGAGRYFSGILGSEMAVSGLFSDVDLVVPVPLHWSRRWSRGHNQAETIARELASALGAELKTKVLVRTRKTRSQAKLSIEEKMSNVRGAFRLGRNGKVPGYQHILIVDDVFTTGSTLFESFCALREFYPPEVRISVASLACVSD